MQHRRLPKMIKYLLQSIHSCLSIAQTSIKSLNFFFTYYSSCVATYAAHHMRSITQYSHRDDCWNSRGGSRLLIWNWWINLLANTFYAIHKIQLQAA